MYAETFTSMVIVDLLREQREASVRMLSNEVLAMLERELGDGDIFHFFKDHERLPADADCTALGLSVMLLGGLRVHDQAHRALDRMLTNTDEHGVLETYFDPTGERDGIVDPIVCSNVIFLAHQLGRGHEVGASLEYVYRVLVERSYLNGSRYYHSPDSFLYFLGRVVQRFPQTRALLREPLRQAVRQRQGVSSHTIDLAQRVLLSAWLDIDDGGELERLLDLQEADGCWPTDALFRYGRKKVFFGSRVMTSAFAMAAITRGVARTMSHEMFEEDAVTERMMMFEGDEPITFRSLRRG